VVLIDLGEDRQAPEDSPSRPAVPVRSRRAALLSGCVALVLAAVGDPVPTQTLRLPDPVRIAVSANAFVAVGDLLLAMRTGSRPPELVAFDADGSRVRWQARLEGTFPRVISAVSMGDVLVVSTAEDLVASEPLRHTYAIDRATGSVRWHRPLSALGPTGDGRLLTVETSAVTGQGWFAAIDPGTGRALWRRPYTEAQQWSLQQVDQQVTGIVLTDGDRNQVWLIEPGSGRIAYEQVLPGPADAAVVAVGLVLIPYDTQSGWRLRALRLPTLEPAWDVPHPVGHGPRFAYDCVPVICVDSDGTQMWLLDPGSGRTLWAAGPWSYFTVAPGLLYGAAAATEQPTLRDVRTGEVLLELGRWRLIGYDGTSVLLIEQQSDRTWFGAVDPAAPGRGVRLLGTRPASIDHCWLAGQVLACDAPDGVGTDIYRYSG
jgi:outer membrane protein assembly factor BamB